MHYQLASFMQIVTNFAARRAHNQLATRTAQSCRVTQLFLLCYSQANILVSETHFAHITSHIQINTLLSTFICSHPSIVFVHDRDTMSLLVSNTAGITIDAEVTFFCNYRVPTPLLWYSQVFVSIPKSHDWAMQFPNQFENRGDQYFCLQFVSIPFWFILLIATWYREVVITNFDATWCCGFPFDIADWRLLLQIWYCHYDVVCATVDCNFSHGKDYYQLLWCY